MRLILLFIASNVILYAAYCKPSICSLTIAYSMGKQRDAIEDRLDDLMGAIDANTNQTKNQTKIIEQEILAYIRLRNRIYKETLLLQEAQHMSKKIKKSSILNQTITTVKEK